MNQAELERRLYAHRFPVRVWGKGCTVTEITLSSQDQGSSTLHRAEQRSDGYRVKAAFYTYPKEST